MLTDNETLYFFCNKKNVYEAESTESIGQLVVGRGRILSRLTPRVLTQTSWVMGLLVAMWGVGRGLMARVTNLVWDMLRLSTCCQKED